MKHNFKTVADLGGHARASFTAFKIRLLFTLMLALAAGIRSLQAQIILHPNQISGTVQFTNTNSAVLNLITNPASPINTYEMQLYASAQAPAAPATTEFNVIVTNKLIIPYQMTVDTGATGIVYQVGPNTIDLAGDYFYTFAAQNTPLLTSNGPPATLNFSQCAGILDLHFVTSGGVPVPILSLSYAVTAAGPNNLVAVQYFNAVPAGTSVTNQEILVPGGGTYVTTVTYGFGTNIYTDTVQYTASLTNTVACDQILRADVVIPSQAQLASAYGNVDLVGEFEMTVPDWYGQYPGFTTVIAQYGPYYFLNARWAAVRGTNFVVPASGAFVLTNLMPNNSRVPPLNYQIDAKMVVGSNRDYATFNTPALGYGSNPGPLLTPGTNFSLGNAFVIQPAYLRTSLLLQGPPETAGYVSGLRNLVFALDPTTSNGIPLDVAVYGLYGTSAWMAGVDALAPGATYTAVGGNCTTIGQGAFNPLTASYEGQVNLRLGGLYSQPSIWQKGGAGIYISQPATNGQPYIYEVGFINSTLTNNLVVSAGQIISNQLDFSYTFSEVRLQVQSSSGLFSDPRVQFGYYGFFAGTNFLGEPDSYSFYVDDIEGTPSYFTNNGLVVMYLPEGNYTLYPIVTSLNADGSTSDTTLQPLSLHVGRAQRISLQSGLQVQLTAPPCTADPARVPISGQVIGSNQIASITVSVNGRPTNVLCTACGLNPTFSTSVSVSIMTCSNSTITVTATDVLGATASTTASVLYSPLPPSIVSCPSNLTVACAGLGGTAVSYSAVGAAGCPGPVAVVFTPPSGTLFPAGTNTVTCYALDACGRQSSPCTFTVTVTNTNPPAILCPSNLVVNCAGTNGTAVIFQVIATSGCDTNVTVVAVPPSGSLFPVGTNIVSCVASDHSGNTNKCSFLVIVQPSVSIELTVTVQWCGNVLQGADNADGPWVDIPSASNPYTVPANQAKQFYRAR